MENTLVDSSETKTSSTGLPFAAQAPVHIGRVGLKARDADGLAAWYKSVLGLEETRRTGATIGLSAGGRELVEIEGSPALKPDDPPSAGLFHTAFLLPSRTELARWLRHAIDERIAISGASDHLVSEAIYLNDAEGNGVEIYADRHPDLWSFDRGAVRMSTERLDIESLLGELSSDTAAWTGAPAGSIVGHVHLRVGDVSAAEDFWNHQMSFDTMLHYGDAAVFMSTGGYHHHVGANTWQSRRAGPRDPDRAGLSFVELRSKLVQDADETRDPWGTLVRTVPD